MPKAPQASTLNKAWKRKRTEVPETIDLCSDDESTSAAPLLLPPTKKRQGTAEKVVTPIPNTDSKPSIQALAEVDESKTVETAPECDVPEVLTEAVPGTRPHSSTLSKELADTTATSQASAFPTSLTNQSHQVAHLVDKVSTPALEIDSQATLQGSVETVEGEVEVSIREADSQTAFQDPTEVADTKAAPLAPGASSEGAPKDSTEATVGRIGRPIPQSRPHVPPKEAAEAAQSTQLPTPHPTPQKPTNTVYNTLKHADRYVRKTSTLEGVEFTNPQKFSLRPPYWERWSGREYAKLAEQLRLQFDPLAISQELGRPVEEIKHVFSALVCNPLYDAKLATTRGKDGMEEILEFHNRGCFTPTRPWGVTNGEQEAVEGELSRVGIECVQIIDMHGIERALKLHELSLADMRYLDVELTEEDKVKLWNRRRKWGHPNEEGKRLFGQLDGVALGEVSVVLRSGKRVVLGVKELSVEDVEYLDNELTMEEKEKLSGQKIQDVQP